MIYSIIPGILEKDFSEIEKKIELVRSFSKTIHVDVIDGKFADNKTLLDPSLFKKYSEDFLLEAHLMVDEPINYLNPFANAGFKRFLGHVEKMSSIEDFVSKAEFLGEVGLAFDLDTEIDSVNLNFEDLDEVLFLGVKAGFSGQQFSKEVIEKIQKLREKTLIPIGIDGGVNDKTITDLLKSGANRFVTTSFLFEGNPISQNEKLLSIVTGFEDLPKE